VAAGPPAAEAGAAGGTADPPPRQPSPPSDDLELAVVDFLIPPDQQARLDAWPGAPRVSST